MTDNTDENKVPEVTEVEEENLPDENMYLFVYGNLLIKDVETGQNLVNKSF